MTGLLFRIMTIYGFALKLLNLCFVLLLLLLLQWFYIFPLQDWILRSAPCPASVKQNGLESREERDGVKKLCVVTIDHMKLMQCFLQSFLRHLNPLFSRMFISTLAPLLFCVDSGWSWICRSMKHNENWITFQKRCKRMNRSAWGSTQSSTNSRAYETKSTTRSGHCMSWRNTT